MRVTVRKTPRRALLIELRNEARHLLRAYPYCPDDSDLDLLLCIPRDHPVCRELWQSRGH